MLLGVDYYPEQWPIELLEEDLQRIVKMGAKAIRIGEFAWHLIESVPGEFNFTYFDEVIKKAEAHGLKVVYGTPTATFPAWLAKQYPDILSMDIQGNRRSFGGRRQYCYNSRTYWEYSERMVSKLVDHYKDASNLVMWQLDNELGHEGSDDCYCPQCHLDFQTFLGLRYGTIDTLNEIYGTMFWGQTYNAFNEIPMPTETITTHNPVLKLDWLRFRDFSIERFAKRQLEIIRKHAGSHQPITHNFYGGYFDRRYDQNKIAENLDFVAYDNYPVWGGLMEPLSPAEISMGHSYMYGLKQAPFTVMEQLIGAQGHDDIGYLPRDGESTLWAAQAMGRGCNSLFYFRYRGAVRGQEQFCQGILDADNKENDKYREVQRFYSWCKAWQSVLEKPLKRADVALVYDYDNRQMWRGQRQSSDFDYTGALLDFYDAFHYGNVPVDVIDLKKNWQGYAVVILPVFQKIDATLAKALKDYVASGGILISGYRAFIKDFDNNLPFGESAPCYLIDLFGMEVSAYEALGDGQSRRTKGSVATVWRDLLKLTAPTATGGFPYESPYSDCYALTENVYGAGKAIYVGAGLEKQAFRALAKRIAQEKTLEWIESPEGLEVIPRAADFGNLWLVLNHNHTGVHWRGQYFEGLSVTWLPENFGPDEVAISPKGERIKRLTLESEPGFKVEVLTYGATLTEIWAKDAQGNRQNVCLRYQKYSDYLKNPYYLGATVGRIAGRTRNAEFELDGTQIYLDNKHHPHNLHSGASGLSFVNWDVISAEKTRLVLAYQDPFSPGKTPGNLEIQVTFEVVGDEGLRITYRAHTDHPTYLNLTNHTYFDLGLGGLEALWLQVRAKGYWPTDQDQLPQDALIALDSLGVSDANGFGSLVEGQMLNAYLQRGIDHPFKLVTDGEPQIVLSHQESGRTLRINTNQDVAVIYTADYLGQAASPSGERFKKQQGICFETQAVPNGPNMPKTGGALWTRPDQPYYSVTDYNFTPV